MAETDLPFARDLGYLDKFLAALRAHAGGRPEPERAELSQLLAEETERWERIKALLSGEGRRPVAAEPRAPARPGLTIGSLMPDR